MANGMNVVNTIMKANASREWISINGKTRTYGDILKEAIKIRDEIVEQTETDIFNYILFIDPKEIEFNVEVLVATTQCESICICFDKRHKDKNKKIFIKGREIYYRKVEKTLNQHKGLIMTKTSGTTGVPKYILYSLKNKIDRASQMKKILNINENDVMLLTTNFSHSLGLRILFTSLVSGCKLKIPNNITLDGITEAIGDKELTKLIVVSLVLANALDKINSNKGNIRGLMLSSSSASADLKNKLIQMNIPTFEMYGASEVGTITVKKLEPDEMDSLGKTQEDTQVRIDNETNEIEVKTKNICMGYLDENYRIKEKFDEDRFFRTGDIGKLNSKGELVFYGRITKEFKSGGIKVNPYVIEQKILKANIDGVVDCVCIDVDDIKLEKVLAMNLLIKENMNETNLKKIRLEILKVLDRHETPRYLRLTTKIKRLENGKLDRKFIESDMVKYVDTLR